MKATSRAGGFTLIELVVVIGLIAALTALFASGLRSNKSAALRSAQTTLANTLTAARLRAQSSGCRVRVLIHAGANDAVRFRRVIAVQQESSYGSGEWLRPASVVTLPPEVLVLPYRNRQPAGLFEAPEQWVKSNGASSPAVLHSSSLSAAPVSVAIQTESPERWDFVQFTPQNTMSSGVGDVVLAMCRARPPGSYAEGESPFVAEGPASARGVSISTYGVVTLINDRGGF